MKLALGLLVGLVLFACKQAAPPTPVERPKPCGLQAACGAGEICVHNPETHGGGSGRSVEGTCPRGETPHVCEAGEAICCLAFITLDLNRYTCKAVPSTCGREPSCACLTGMCGRYSGCQSVDAGTLHCAP